MLQKLTETAVEMYKQTMYRNIVEGIERQKQDLIANYLMLAVMYSEAGYLQSASDTLDNIDTIRKIPGEAPFFHGRLSETDTSI